MSLERLFNPKSVAVIGASRDPKKVGHGVLKNLLDGCVFKQKFCRPFLGKIYAVNPNSKKILGIRTVAKVSDIKDDIDLAIICVPAARTMEVMRQCAAKKVRNVIVISAGFAETGTAGRRLQAELVKIAKKAKMRLLGPNCLGIIIPGRGLNASFAPTMPPNGKIAFISQSGALADSIIDWAVEEKYGFSAVVSYGNAADLSLPEFLEWFGQDENTSAIALYIESVKDGRQSMKIARKVAGKKPIIALKAGNTVAGAAAAASHTGSIAGDSRVYRAAFEQSGITVAESVEELFDLAKALASQPSCENQVAIISNAGGPAVLCADACAREGIRLVELKDSTIRKLEKTRLMHPAYSKRNPLDIVGDALPERYEAAINTLLGEPYVKGLIIIQTLQTMTDAEKDAQIVVRASKKFRKKPILCVYMGGRFSRKSVRLLEENDIPDFNDVAKAARAMKGLVCRNEFLKSSKKPK